MNDTILLLSRMHKKAIKMKEYYRGKDEDLLEAGEICNVIASICSKQAALCEILFDMLDKPKESESCE